MAMQLEQYLDSLQKLPNELRRNLTSVRELDEDAQDNLRKADLLKSDYHSSAHRWGVEKREKQIQEIHNHFKKAKSIGDEKIHLALQTYEIVDKHIRRLDNDLAKFEGELKQKFLGKAGFVLKRPGKKDKVSGRRRGLGDETPRIVKRKNKKLLSSFPLPTDPETFNEMSGPELIHTLTGESTDVLDMPVDPNEPTYCICHQVSYGEMIGCDNNECPIEWFHFGCVGLSNKPKGKWYCPKCREDRKK